MVALQKQKFIDSVVFAIKKKHNATGIETGKWKTTSIVLLCLTVRPVHSVTVCAENWTLLNKTSNPRTTSVWLGAIARLKTLQLTAHQLIH